MVDCFAIHIFNSEYIRYIFKNIGVGNIISIKTISEMIKNYQRSVHILRTMDDMVKKNPSPILPCPLTVFGEFFIETPISLMNQ